MRQEPGENFFSAAMCVNSRPGSAIAVASIRGAHLAMGKDRRVHVAWQVFDRLGRPLEEKRSVPGKTERVPVWGLVAAYANPDGTFVVLY